ncbi:MAG: alpha/beta fold hydrolase [Ilumatobacteraceae bacterium]|jgi:pimeloyl-ACP methyl ester carboxylesterase
MSSRHVVLVHGAWHGAWCWSALQTELDRRGVPSIAIDLPGHGASTAPLADMHTDARCVADTLKVLRDRGIHDPVLVGHSYGGAVISQAAVFHPHIAHLVYVAAFALNDGESVMSALVSFPPGAVGLQAAMVGRDDGTSVLDPALAKPALYGDCDPIAADAALARLSPQPTATVTQPTQGSPRESIPSTYVLCRRDDAVHPEHQEIMAARCGATIVLDTDHSPFLSMVRETADILESIARS